MAYVDGIVTPVPKRKLAAYKKMAKSMAKVFMKYGALAVTECVADDVKPGKATSFPQAVKLKAGETVIFSWVVYKNKAARERCWKQVMKDPAMANWDPKKTPFDGKRMFWGGFKTLVEAR
jgi:uncharacterized protein YbaA (DUF1428 family)